MRSAFPIAVVLAVVIAGCSPVAQAPQPQAQQSPGGQFEDNFGKPPPGNLKQGGTLTVALDAEPDMLDPSLGRSLVGRQVFHAMCEKLYDLDQSVKLVPQLAAELPQTSADGLTVTIKLRQGIKFADGTELNAEAVKKSLDRHLTLATSPRKSELGPIKAVAATDPQTVTITLQQPFAPLAAALADRAGMVMSPKALDALGEKFASGPVCVGPYKFAKRVPQSAIELEKDPNYYNADKVRFDKIVYRIIEESAIRAANLRSGDIQVAMTISTQEAPQLAQEQNIELLQSLSLGYQALTFNVGNQDGVGQPPRALTTEIATKPQVRQAFEHAVDRDVITKTVFNGYHRPACGPISPDTPYTSERVQQCRAHDPAKAKQLLQEAGVQIPFPIKMSVANNPDTLRLAQALQAMVKDGGFELTIEPVEFATLLDQQDRGGYELIQIGWSGRVDPDANIFNFIGTGAGQNVSGYSTKEVDDLLTKARGQSDPAERATTYAAMIEKLQQDNPLIYLYRQRNLTGVSRTLGGVQMFQDGIMRVAFSGQTS